MSNIIEFLTEQRKLEDILNILNEKTYSYIEKRKALKDYILESRKKYIEEFKDDEDLVTDYFDHENYVKEEAYNAIDKKLLEMAKLKESPYFGKVTFKEQEEELPEDIYVGRYGVTNKDDSDVVIVDWRAPIASLFYKGTFGKATYNIPDGTSEAEIIGRKQIVIKKGDLKGVFDSALDVKDEILQMVLSDNSSEKLKDIVMTIQKEQDEIIREDRKKIVVVDGVAGSGKTTIALHRVSYLLYNFRNIVGDKILIFGPNDIFMDYIAQVLPTLGESNIDETTFESFAIKEIMINEPVKKFSEYVEEVMNGNTEYLEEFKYKYSKKFIYDLDKMINDMNQNYFKISPVYFDGEEIVSEKEIKELFEVYYKDMPLFRRSEKIRRILVSKIKDKRDELYYELLKEINEKKESMSESELEIEGNNLDFKKNIRIREIVRLVINAREELDSWITHEKEINIYKEKMNIYKLSFMDLSAILYLMIRLSGKKYSKEIKHIVIDESQDYSYIQFKVIKELTGCKSYTIVGDSNQRLISAGNSCAMSNLEEIFEQDKDQICRYELSRSYRSTQEIMEYANKFLDEVKVVPLVRHGEEVMEEEIADDSELIDTVISLIEDYEEEGLQNIAVIFNSKECLEKFAPLIKQRINILKLDNEEIIYKGGKVLIPAYLAKGLEFDGVVIIEDKKSDPLVKYIMCTRALHRLAITYYSKNK